MAALRFRFACAAHHSNVQRGDQIPAIMGMLWATGEPGRVQSPEVIIEHEEWTVCAHRASTEIAGAATKRLMGTFRAGIAATMTHQAAVTLQVPAAVASSLCLACLLLDLCIDRPPW